ncbi:hypothetical protein NKG05_23805 [Oerskovia sp. M15]
MAAPGRGELRRRARSDPAPAPLPAGLRRPLPVPNATVPVLAAFVLAVAGLRRARPSRPGPPRRRRPCRACA